MNIQEFEKHIHTSLHNTTAPVDEAALFQALGIEEKKNRTYLIPILCFGLALAVIGGVFWARSTTNTSCVIPARMTEKAAKHPSTSISRIATASYEDNKAKASSSPASHNRITPEIAPQTEKTTLIINPNQPTKKHSTSVAFIKKESPSDDTRMTVLHRHPTTSEKQSREDLAHSASANQHNRMTLSEVQPLTKLSSKLLYESEKLKSSKKIECPRFTPPDVVLKLGMEASLGGTHKTLSMQTTETTEVFEQRKNNENALENIGLKVFTEIESRKLPVGLKVGAEFTRYVEKMRYKDSFVQIDTTVGIISQTVSPNGDTITTIYGDIITETEVTVDKVRHFSLFTLDIPVTATYELPIGKSSGLQLELGASLNFRTWKRGSILTDMNTFTPASEANYFRSSMGISMIGQVNYRRSLLGGIAYIGVGIRHIPTSLSLGSTQTTHKYTSAGLKLGYIMRL